MEFERGDYVRILCYSNFKHSGKVFTFMGRFLSDDPDFIYFEDRFEGKKAIPKCNVVDISMDVKA